MDSEPKKLDGLLANIQVIPFHKKHLPLLHEMLKDQNFTHDVPYVSLPKIGYIAMLGDQPIAAGFLRRVECDIVAQLDGLTSNPMFGSIIRHKAISDVVDQLIMEAKRLKLQGVIAHTKDEGIMKRATELGFRLVSEHIIALKTD